jgi:hypothetical protein
MSNPDPESNQNPAQEQQAARNLERRSAQAILATYLQMARYGEFARHLQRTRERAIEHRMRQASDLEQATRLQKQLEAQQGQSATLDSAMERLHSRAPELASFAEAGLTYDDFKNFGLENVVKKEDIEAAHARAEERRRSQAGSANRVAADSAVKTKSRKGKAKAKAATAKGVKPGPAITAETRPHRPAAARSATSAERKPAPSVNPDVPMMERPAPAPTGDAETFVQIAADAAPRVSEEARVESAASAEPTAPPETTPKGETDPVEPGT